MAAAGPSGIGRGLLLGVPADLSSSDGALDGSALDEHLVGWLRRRLEWQTFATRQIDCNATADIEELEEGETKVVTPRGWAIDMCMSVMGGVLCGYLFVQLTTVFYYMNSHSLKPKQPHVLLWQTLSAMVLTSLLLIYHGHFDARRAAPRPVTSTSFRPQQLGALCGIGGSLSLSSIREDHSGAWISVPLVPLGWSRGPTRRAPFVILLSPCVARAGSCLLTTHITPRVRSLVRRMGCSAFARCGTFGPSGSRSASSSTVRCDAPRGCTRASPQPMPLLAGHRPRAVVKVHRKRVRSSTPQRRCSRPISAALTG